MLKDRLDIAKLRINSIITYESEMQKILKKIEKKLFKRFDKDVIGKLSLTDRSISDSLANLSFQKTITEIIEKIKKEELTAVSKQFISDLNKIGKSIEKQYKFLGSDSTITALSKTKDKALKSALGVLGDKIDKGGFLEDVLSLKETSARLKNELFKASFSKFDIDDFRENIKQIVVSDNKEGILTSTVKNRLNDVYSQFDRAKSQGMAKELKMTAFIYYGSNINTTRPFCKDKAGKVFLEDEFKTIAMNAKGQDLKGRPKNYNPLIDLGGYNCRHTKEYLTDREAERSREDLKIINGKITIVK